MGKWDAELVHLLPETVKVFASAGAGFDWADTQLLAERGESIMMLTSSMSSAQLTSRQESSTAILASPLQKPLPTLQLP